MPASDRLNLALVALLGFCGAVVGDNIGFSVGHFGRGHLAERYGRYVFLTPDRLARATGFVDRDGARSSCSPGFIEGLRQANGIIAGASGMGWRRFLVFNAIGAALWVLVWTSVCYFSGSHIDAIYGDVTHYETYLVTACGVLLLAYIARRVVRVHRLRSCTAQ